MEEAANRPGSCKIQSREWLSRDGELIAGLPGPYPRSPAADQSCGQ